MEQTRKPPRNVRRKLRQARRNPLTARVCGHLTAKVGWVRAFGDETITEMPNMKDGGVAYCLVCLGQMAIRCAWCKNTIFIGDPVTLYHNIDGTIPEGATVHDPVRGSVVGCLGWNCAITGADRAGFWHPDPNNHGRGYVYRMMSPIEQMLVSGQMVIVEDIAKP